MKARERPALLMDILNPCWIYQSADLTKGLRFEAAVGQVPFNFQIGADRDKIRLGAPRTPHGELEVRIDGCEGEPALILPLAEAAGNDGITTLSGELPARAGQHDLCLKFTQKELDPMWGVDWVRVSDPAAKRDPQILPARPVWVGGHGKGQRPPAGNQQKPGADRSIRPAQPQIGPARGRCPAVNPVAPRGIRDLFRRFQSRRRRTLPHGHRRAARFGQANGLCFPAMV